MADPKTAKKVEFEAGGKRYVAVAPTRKDLRDADVEKSAAYVRLFLLAKERKALLNRQVDQAARALGLWDDGREAEAEALRTQLADGARVLAGKVRGTTRLQARATAVAMRAARARLFELAADTNDLYANTVEAQANDAEFHFVMTRCVRTADNKPVYASVDDLLTREDDPVFGPAFDAVLTVFKGYDRRQEVRDRPENKFLLENGYCDDQLRLIDPATKRLVDVDLHPVDEDGFRVGPDGKRLGAEEDEVFPFADDGGAAGGEPAA
jgi:hypothetical protein